MLVTLHPTIALATARDSTSTTSLSLFNCCLWHQWLIRNSSRWQATFLNWLMSCCWVRWCGATTMLLNCIDQFLKCLFEKLCILCSNSIPFREPGLNCKQSCLIQLLRFDQRFYPVILSFFELFYDVLLYDQVLLILRKVFRTDILDLL